MECTTEVPYISIYDKPKRRTLTREEKLERLRQNYKRYHYENPERESLRKKKEYARKKEEAKKYEYHENIFGLSVFIMNFIKTVFGFLKNEFPFKEKTRNRYRSKKNIIATKLK